jgi:hypothetical protein
MAVESPATPPPTITTSHSKTSLGELSSSLLKNLIVVEILDTGLEINLVIIAQLLLIKFINAISVNGDMISINI